MHPWSGVGAFTRTKTGKFKGRSHTIEFQKQKKEA